MEMEEREKDEAVAERAKAKAKRANGTHVTEKFPLHVIPGLGLPFELMGCL